MSKMYKFIFCIFVHVASTFSSTIAGTNKSVSHDSSSSQLADPVVKKSNSNVCYEKSHIGYRKTMTYTAFNSMDDCRNSGGRAPKVKKHN